MFVPVCQRQCPVPFAQQSTLLGSWSDFWSIWNLVWGSNMWSRRARRSFWKTSLRKSASTVNLSGELWLLQHILMGLINTNVFISLFVDGMWFVFFTFSVSTGSVRSGYSLCYELSRLLTSQTSRLLLSSLISPPWSARIVKVLKQLFHHLLCETP